MIDLTAVYTSPVLMLQCFCFTDIDGVVYTHSKPSLVTAPIVKINVHVPELGVLSPIPSAYKCSHYEGKIYYMSEGSPGGKMQNSMCWKMLTYHTDTKRVWGTSVDLYGVVRAGWTDEGEALDWNMV